MTPRQTARTTGHLRLAPHRWAHAMGDPLFFSERDVNPHDEAPRIARSRCARINDSYWDEFLAHDRPWTHCIMRETTAGELVVSLEAGRPLDEVPVGFVLTGHVHVGSPSLVEILGD